MYLEIRIRDSVKDLSFRFGGYYFGKDEESNAFFTLLSEQNHIFTSWLVHNGRTQKILTNADSRKATDIILRKKGFLNYRLSIEGANMLRQAYNEIGLSSFCFFEDNQVPTPSSKLVSINDLTENFLLDIGKSVSIIREEL